MAVDMVEFNQLEEIEEDYILEDFFPTPLPYPLQPLIEYRIKLVTKENIVFLGGESQIVNTACVINKKNSLTVKLVNYTSKKIKSVRLQPKPSPSQT